jgi:DnaJ like chaperone protein
MTVWQKISEVATSVGSGGAALLSYLARSATTGSEDQTPDLGPDLGTSFTIAMIALAAKMAKADGIVLPSETDAFHRVMKTEPSEAASVARLFRLAQQDVTGFEVYADQIRVLLRADHRLLRDVLEALFHIASADRAIHPAESKFLETVAQRFGLTTSEYLYIRAHFVVDQTSPYDVLGLDPSVSDEEIKRRHRRLVRENHPDLAIARGVPKELIDTATRKLAAINAAYAIVAKERKL